MLVLVCKDILKFEYSNERNVKLCFFKTTIYLGRYLCKLENKLY